MRLQLFALAQNLAKFLRRLALPKPVRQWSLTTLGEKLIKIGAKVVRHAGYVTFQMAEVCHTAQAVSADSRSDCSAACDGSGSSTRVTIRCASKQWTIRMGAGDRLR